MRLQLRTLALSLAFVGPTTNCLATTDPALIVLGAKVGVLGVLLDVIEAQITLHIAQHQAMEPLAMQSREELLEARRRSFEQVLLECALHPARCIPPMYLTSAVDADCVPPPVPPPDDHGIGFDCPIREIVIAVEKALAAVQAQGLGRDLARAEGFLAGANAALVAGDGREAFDQACAAYKELACP